MLNMTTLAKNLSLAMAQSSRYATQEKLADALNISQAAIQKILAGDTKQPRYIIDMAKLLHVSAEWLTKDVGSMNDLGVNQVQENTPPTYLRKEASDDYTDLEREDIAFMRTLSRDSLARARAAIRIFEEHRENNSKNKK